MKQPCLVTWVVKDINKAHAIDVLLEHLKAKRSRTPLLSEMPRLISLCWNTGEIGVAMGNGGPEILAMAD